MAMRGDSYRLRAADMHAISEEYGNLAKAFLRLAEQADRNALAPEQPALEGQQPQPTNKAND